MDGGVGDGKVLVIGIVGQDVLVGGNFLQAGGVAAKNLARLDSISRTWTAMGDFNGKLSTCACLYCLRVMSILVHVCISVLPTLDTMFQVRSSVRVLQG